MRRDSPLLSLPFIPHSFGLGGGMAGKALKSPVLISPAPVGIRPPGLHGPVGPESAAMAGGLLMTASPLHLGKMTTATSSSAAEHASPPGEEHFHFHSIFALCVA
jgi:hypothetical protein